MGKFSELQLRSVLRFKGGDGGRTARNREQDRKKKYLSCFDHNSGTDERILPKF
jgi:hypothetical protein